MNRLMIFIDAEYVVQKMRDFRLANTQTKRKDILWFNIIKWITGKRRLIRCYYYSAEFSKEENPQTYNEQSEYFKDLQKAIPYFQIKLGRLVKIQGGGWIQKGLDVKIALDMFSNAVKNHYDTAALISGDSDFTEVISAIKEQYARHVELYTFDRSIHQALQLSPDKHIVITPQTARKYGFSLSPDSQYS